MQLNGSDESYDATVVGQDSTSDIAVLKIDATGLTPAVIGDSDALAVGEVAVAVGNPLGTLSNTMRPSARATPAAACSMRTAS